MEGFIFGVLATLCIVFIGAIIVLVRSNKKKDQINEQFDRVFDLIKNLPRNVIQLSLRGVDVDTKLPPLELPISPENLVVNVDKLKGLLLKSFETQKHPNPDTRAYCILNHAGLESIVRSTTELRKPLSIMLINEDFDGAKKYLETLAESICAEMLKSSKA